MRKPARTDSPSFSRAATSTEEAATLSQRTWMDKPPSEWPPEARIAFGILAEIAEIRLAEAVAKTRKREAL